jgi:hypothetical protein
MASRSDIRSRRNTAGSSRADRATRAASRKASAILAAMSNGRSRFPSGSMNREGRGGWSTQEAVLLRLREKALKGDARSIVQILELAKIFNNSTAVESVGDEALAADDQAILDAYAEEVRSRPPSGAITVRPGVAEDSGANLDG